MMTNTSGNQALREYLSKIIGAEPNISAESLIARAQMGLGADEFSTREEIWSLICADKVIITTNRKLCLAD